MARRVEPRLVRGMQDFLPAAAAARQALVEKVRAVYESYGFAPLQTSAIEHWDVLVGSAGEEAREQVFRVESADGDELGLRFDLTVPLSRVVAAHQQDLPRPFRRYQVGSSWRQDKPGPGRFREFVQFDADIVGSSSPVADAEIVAAMASVFDALLGSDERGPRYRIRFSDRRLLDVLLRRAGIEAGRTAEVLRVVDKLGRIGAAKVAAELTTGYADESGDRIRGLGLPAEGVAVVLEFLALGSGSRDETAGRIGAFLDGTDGAGAAVDAVGALLRLLDVMGVDDRRATLDPSIARGLAYYTGPVFETELRDAPQFGSACSGGRYDDLVSRFSGQPWPGVGTSVGIDRLLAALRALDALPEAAAAHAQVLVTVMDRARSEESARIARSLREAGLRVELWAGSPGSVGKQLRHADRCGIPVAVLAGEDELARGMVTVKRMGEARPEEVAGREEWLAARFGQQEVPRAGLVAAVRQALAS